jgi:hypothetical protein
MTTKWPSVKTINYAARATLSTAGTVLSKDLALDSVTTGGSLMLSWSSAA